MFDIHKLTITSPNHTYIPDSLKNSLTPCITDFEQTKQIIMETYTLSQSPMLHNKILQELNLNGLCQYNKTHQANLYESSKKVVNCSYILVFLKQSTCYIITPDTHRINTNEILENHKIAHCNDPAVHMVPIPPAELSEINAFNTIGWVTILLALLHSVIHD